MELSILPRLVSIHPILVHVTLGVLPVILVAYGVAMVRRSPGWSFAGDVALWVGAAITLATAAFGFVSNAVLEWPGGLGTWRWSHLGFAAVSTLAFLALAVWRFLEARRGNRANGGALVAIFAISVLYTVTGWLGGEVLVYRAGMAVEAAGQGALAPLASNRGTGKPPGDVDEAMARLRASWAIASTEYATMLVHRPDDASYDRIAKAAIDIQGMARWLAAEGAEQMSSHEHEEGTGEQRGEGGSGAGEGTEEPQGGDPAERAHEGAEEVQREAQELVEHARALETAARARDWEGLGRGLSGVTQSCAHCHGELRWRDVER